MYAKPHVIVIGGGYAGLTLMRELAGSGVFELSLIDRNPSFLDVARLHQTVHSPIESLRRSYPTLAERYGFRFLCADLKLSPKALTEWDRSGKLVCARRRIAFDYLVVCSGARAPELPGEVENTYGLERLRTIGLKERLQGFLRETDARTRAVSIIGGGPSGVQVLFELDDFLRRERERCQINFVHQEKRLLQGFPESFHDYTLEKIRSRNGTIDYYPATTYRGHGGGRIELSSGERRFIARSDLALLFPGLQPQPAGLSVDAYGRLRVGNETFHRVFAAGDCARFAGGGFDALTAQAAVRKAKRVADNLRRHAKGWELKPYDYQALGYFVSLGTGDGLGWLLREGNRISGIPAFAVKSLVEAQFALYLDGVDMFITP